MTTATDHAASLWHLDQWRAGLRAGPLAGQVDVRTPRRGLHLLAWDQAGLAGMEVLGVSLPDVPPGGEASLAAHLRGRDLVGIYEQFPLPELRTLIYWRASLAAARQVCLDLQVSVQTSAWQADSRLDVASRLAASEAWRLAAGGGSARPVLPAGDGSCALLPEEPAAILFRLPGGAVSYLEMLHPDEFRQGQVRRLGPLWELTQTLFAADLEKGVLLRARLRGVWLARAGDLENAAGLYADFLAAPLPLTA